jgi:hypothetical protein
MKLAILIGSVTSHSIGDFHHPYVAPAQGTDSVDTLISHLSRSNLKTNCWNLSFQSAAASGSNGRVGNSAMFVHLSFALFKWRDTQILACRLRSNLSLDQPQPFLQQGDILELHQDHTVAKN